MHPLRLRPHVFLCTTPQGLVFMDLKRNKYLGINSIDAHKILAMKSGESFAPDATAIIDRLKALELLSTLPEAGKPFESTTIEPARASALDPWPATRPKVRVTHILKFAIALTRVLLLQGTRSLEYQVMAIRNRSQKRLGNQTSPDTCRELLHVFRYVRTLFYTVEDRCLFNSMVLLEFLYLNGLSATWVFGVKNSPFLAHCWVQSDGIVLNGLIEEVAQFTPIMAA